MPILVKPKVSIIIPVYNVEQYLRLCLDSVLDQTMQDFEAICVDDGSSDSSAAILRQYAQKDARIKVFSQVNQGQSVARNVGLDLALGEYVFFLDSDDALPPYAMEFLCRIAFETQLDLVLSDCFLRDFSAFDTDPEFSYQIYHHGLNDHMRLRHAQSTSCNKLYRAESLKGLRFVPGIVFEDWVFATIYFAAIKSFAVTSVPLYFYNTQGQSTIRSSFIPFKIESYMRGVRAVFDFYKDKDELPTAKKRMITALKMCINSCYRDKLHRAQLAPLLLEQLEALYKDGVCEYSQLPIKSRFRLFLMRRMLR